MKSFVTGINESFLARPPRIMGSRQQIRGGPPRIGRYGEKKMNPMLKNNKGQNIVEFALVVPLLFLLVLGIAEFGRAWMTRNVLTGAAREAVRVAAVSPPVGGEAAAITRATDLLSSAGITPKSVLPSEETTADGQTVVKITIEYDFQSAAGNFLGFGTIPLTCSTTMRKEY